MATPYIKGLKKSPRVRKAKRAFRRKWGPREAVGEEGVAHDKNHSGFGRNGFLCGRLNAQGQTLVIRFHDPRLGFHSMLVEGFYHCFGNFIRIHQRNRHHR